MRSRSILFYLALAFLIMGIFVGEAEARRKILRGRKTITRKYYKSSALPAWSFALIAALLMLVAGGGLYLILKKVMIDSVELSDVPTYQPAMTDEV